MEDAFQDRLLLTWRNFICFVKSLKWESIGINENITLILAMQFEIPLLDFVWVMTIEIINLRILRIMGTLIKVKILLSLYTVPYCPWMFLRWKIYIELWYSSLSRHQWFSKEKIIYVGGLRRYHYQLLAMISFKIPVKVRCNLNYSLPSRSRANHSTWPIHLLIKSFIHKHLTHTLSYLSEISFSY